MKPEFPLQVEKHCGVNDQPPGPDTWGVFDAGGYWANLGGVTFQAPAEMPGAQTMVEHVATMCNAAYERGRADRLAELQDGLEPLQLLLRIDKL
jgi:hypothetical protein